MCKTTIEFIEKSPYKNSAFWNSGLVYPMYMKKDGEEYFLWGRAEDEPKFRLEEIEKRKQQLIDNGGAYFKFHDNSGNNDPIGFLQWVKNNHYTLCNDCKAKLLSDNKTFDFVGNLNEVSCAFFYRIFDKEMINTVSEAIKTMKKKRSKK